MRKNLTSGRIALVLSSIALLLALGGTAYAVNTVRSSDIVNGTIRTEDLGTGSVRSLDIKNGAVGRLDIAASSLGRTPTLMARVNTVDGSLIINRGGMNGPAEENTTGRWTLQAGRDITNCLYVATPRASGVSVSVDQASTTAVNVYLDDVTTGTGINTDFDIVFFC